MHLRNPLKDATTAMRAGMSALILASFTRWFLRPSARLGPDVVDAAMGLLYGVAIGCLLLSVALNRRARPR